MTERQVSTRQYFHCSRGPDELNKPVPVAAYRVADDGSEILLGVTEFSDFIDDGHAGPAQELSFPVQDALPSLRLVVGDDGTGVTILDDCDASNDSVEISFDDCEADSGP